MSKRKMMTRWVPIVRRTPSGKLQFVCTICGRVSIAPDKECPPFEDWTTDELRTLRCADLERQ